MERMGFASVHCVDCSLEGRGIMESCPEWTAYMVHRLISRKYAGDSRNNLHIRLQQEKVDKLNIILIPYLLILESCQ